MEAILAQRFSFCDFSNVVGFPNPMLSRGEWEGTLPTFKGKYWEVPAEHLLDFHKFVHERQIVHEDVQIKLFRYSLKGAALDWCRSLPASSINSLASFHDAFNIFYKEKFSAESLFENCCDIFEKYIQQKADFSSDCKNENHVVEEYFKDTIDDGYKDCIVVVAFDLVPDAPAVFDLNKKALVYDEYKEQVFPQHIVVDESHKHNRIEEGYQQPDIFMVTEVDQQIYENIMHVSHEQSELVYGNHASEVDKENIEQQAKVTMFGYQSTSFFYDLDSHLCGVMLLRRFWPCKVLNQRR
jgi:hypothetical protein